jgi:RHS repeat-associated protein
MNVKNKNHSLFAIWLLVPNYEKKLHINLDNTAVLCYTYINDASSAPIGMMYRATSYAEGAWDVFWYEKNLQGDIIAVYNASGTKVATYTYSDAWGNHYVSYSNGGGSTGAQYNPFRYRGYYYDSDLGMYYLQSRYYDAKICRFINSDSYTSTGQGILSTNMFAYCINNPVNRVDYLGFWSSEAFEWFRRFVNEVLYPTSESIRDKFSDCNGTLSIGVSITFSLGTFVVNYQFSLAMDTSGDMVLQYTQGDGLGVGYGTSLTGFVMITNAPSVDELEGVGYQIGGSAGKGKCLGGDFILIPNDSRVYNGMDVNFGYCTPGKEVHVIRGYTNNSETKINVFDIVRNIHYTINGGWT